MKRNLKRKNYNLDEKKDPPREDDPGCDDQTEAIDAALNLVVFREEILKSLEKVAGKGGVEKVFLVAKHLIDTDLYIDLIQSGTTLPFIHEIYYNDAPGIYFSSTFLIRRFERLEQSAAVERLERAAVIGERRNRLLEFN